MPLRDHFRPPVSKHSSWEGFHGGWPMAIVQQLVRHLPADYSAEPRVHLGPYFEIDVCAFDDDESKPAQPVTDVDSGGVATATWAPPEPTLIVDTDLAEQYEYEVRVYDQSRGRVLVAAVELVSPGNKDRPDTRRAFVNKCAALLQQDVSVSIVDLVTTRSHNLYVDLLASIDCSDPTFVPEPPSIYAVTCRGRNGGAHPQIAMWAYPLKIGQPLPTLPLWLTEFSAVSLELEASYEETCRTLRIAEPSSS